MKPLLIAVIVIKVGLSFSKKAVLFASMKALQKWWKILFCHKSSFHSQDFWIFVLTFGHIEKAAWLERQGLFQNLWPLSVQQTITIHMLPNILQSKSNQAIKFGQVIENSRKNIFLQKSCGKWARQISSRHFCFF